MPKFTWNVDPVLVNLGPFPIRWYSLLFVGVFLGGYALLNWQIRRGGGDEEEAGDFIVYGVLGVLVGARLGHVLFYDLDKALADPFWVLMIWTGGLASHGAVVGLIIAMHLFTKRRRISFLEGADRFAFSAALGATLVRIGNFFNSEIIGNPTDQSWGVRLLRYQDDPIRYRHPTQLYEAAIGIFVLLALLVFDRVLGKERRPRGALISLFFALYFPLRFVVEFYKEHQVFHDATLDMGQYLSIPGALLGFYGLYWSFKRRIPAGWYGDHDADSDVEERAFRDPDVDAEFGDEEQERPPRTRKRKKKKKKTGKRKAKSAKSSSLRPELESAEDETNEPGTPKDEDADDDDGDVQKSDADPASDADITPDKPSPR